MVYTSGTTADPKGVLHSANSLLAEVWQSYPDNDPASRVMSPYPAGHVAGALGVLAPAAAARRTDRKSVVEGKRVAVRVDRGGRRAIKKKTIKREDQIRRKR